MKQILKKFSGALLLSLSAIAVLLCSATAVFAEEESKSLGAIMQEAGLNTLMGLGIVFLVLIFLSFIISLFRLIPKPGKPEAPKAAPVSAPATAAVEEEEETDDLELVAVITAAIAASEGKSPEGYVVRSIRRRYR